MSDHTSPRRPSAMPLGALLGVEVEQEDAERVVCRLVIGEDHLNQGLVPHGGVLFALADTALGLLVNPPGEATTWVGTAFSLQLFRAARLGEGVRATATLEHRSRSIAACRVLLERERDGALVGTLANQLLASPPPAGGDGQDTPAPEVRAHDAASPLVRALRAAWRRDVGPDEEGGGPDAAVLVVYEEAQPCGYAAVAAGRPGPARVPELWVHPRWRRRGLGAALLRAVEAGAGTRR